MLTPEGTLEAMVACCTLSIPSKATTATRDIAASVKAMEMFEGWMATDEKRKTVDPEHVSFYKALTVGAANLGHREAPGRLESLRKRAAALLAR